MPEKYSKLNVKIKVLVNPILFYLKCIWLLSFNEIFDNKSLGVYNPILKTISIKAYEIKKIKYPHTIFVFALYHELRHAYKVTNINLLKNKNSENYCIKQEKDANTFAARMVKKNLVNIKNIFKYNYDFDFKIKTDEKTLKMTVYE